MDYPVVPYQKKSGEGHCFHLHFPCLSYLPCHQNLYMIEGISGKLGTNTDQLTVPNSSWPSNDITYGDIPSTSSSLVDGYSCGKMI